MITSTRGGVAPRASSWARVTARSVPRSDGATDAAELRSAANASQDGGRACPLSRADESLVGRVHWIGHTIPKTAGEMPK